MRINARPHFEESVTQVDHEVSQISGIVLTEITVDDETEYLLKMPAEPITLTQLAQLADAILNFTGRRTRA